MAFTTITRPELISAEWRYAYGLDGPVIECPVDLDWKSRMTVRVTDVTITLIGTVAEGEIDVKIEGRRLKADGSPDGRFGYNVPVYDSTAGSAFIRMWRETDGKGLL